MIRLLSATVGSVAAPVTKDQELELQIDSLAYGGNGVARLNGFVVFVRRGAAGGHRAGPRHEGEAEPRGGGRRSTWSRPAPPRVEAPCEHFGLRRLPLPGSRLRGPGRGQGAAGRATRSSGSAGSPDSSSSRSCRPSRSSTTGTSSSTPSPRLPDGPALGFHRAGRWDEVLDVERCWLTTDLGNAIRDAVRDWARAEGAARVRPGDGGGLPSPPRRARGAEHGPGARRPRDGARRAARRRRPRRGAAPASRRCARSTGR